MLDFSKLPLSAAVYPASISHPVLDTAILAAQKAGAIVRYYFEHGVTMRSKESYNLVSDADVNAEKSIADTIRSFFPDHEVLGEEGHEADLEASDLWIIDPLDGTNNFAHQIPHFAISIGYYRNGQAECGVIYNPIREDWYVTVRGQGAYCNSKSVHVNDDSALEKSMIGIGFYYDRGEMMEATLSAVRDFFRQQIHGVRRFGTASLDLCHVGMGMFGAYFEYQLHPWDFAAGKLFVEEAGGKVTDCEGQLVPIAKTSLLATNGLLHTPSLEITKKHWHEGKPRTV